MSFLFASSHWFGRCELCCFVFFFQAEDGIRDDLVTGVQTCALPISAHFSLRQRPCILYCPFLVAGAPRFLYCPFLFAAAPALFLLTNSCCGSAPTFLLTISHCGSAPLFILPGFRCGSAPAFYTAHFSLRQRPRFFYLPILVAAAPPLDFVSTKSAGARTVD